MFKSNNQKSLLKVIVNGYSHCHGGGNGHSNSHNASHREAGYVALTSVLILSALFVIISVAAFGSSVTEMGNISGSISSSEASNITSDCINLALADIKEGDKEIFFGIDNFNVLNEDNWQVYGESYGDISINNSELTITNNSGSTEDFIGIATKINFPVGTVVKARVKNTEGQHSSMVAIGKDPFNPYPHSDIGGINKGASLYSRAGYTSATVSIRDEGGYDNYKSPTVQDYTSYQIVTLKRTSENLIEYFVEGEKVGEWSGIELKDSYYVYFSADGHTKPNTIVVDWVKIINPFEKNINDDKKCEGEIINSGELGYTILSEGQEGLFSKKTKTNVATLDSDPLITNTENYSGNYLIKSESNYSDWQLGNNDSQVNTKEEDLKLPEFGNALKFNEDNNEHFKTSSGVYAAPSDGDPFSLAAWVKTGSSSGAIVGKTRDSFKESATDSNIHLDIQDDGSVGWQLEYDGSNDEDILNGSKDIADGEWHHVVGVRDNWDFYIYVDGELDAHYEKSDYYTDDGYHEYNTALNPNAEIDVAHYRGTANFSGVIDDVRIYNKALSEGEIEKIMYKEATGSEPELMGYWNFNEGSGTVAEDLSPYNNDGDLINGPTWIDSISKGERTSTLNLSSISSLKKSTVNWADKSGLGFDGVDDYVQISNFKGVTGTKERTTTLWFKADSSKVAHGLVRWGLENTGEKYVIRVHDGKHLRVENDGGQKYDKDYIITDGKWHHLAVIFPPYGDSVQDHKLYVDGNLVTNTGGTDQSLNTAEGADVHIGDPAWNHEFVDGKISDVRIYDRALSQKEVKKIMNKQTLKKETQNLLGWWKLNEGEGSTAPDSSGNGNDGTLMPDYSTGNAPKWVSTKIEAATINKDTLHSLDFDGTDDYVSIDSSVQNLEDFTISSWIYREDFTDTGREDWISIDDDWSPGGDNITLLKYDNKIRHTRASAGSYVLTSSALDGEFGIYGDEWVHVALTQNRTSDTNVDLALYINGVQDATTSMDAENLNISSFYNVGRQKNYGRYFKGAIDDVRIYDRALSQDEIEDLYHKKAVNGGLVSYLPFKEGEGTTVYDNSVNSGSGTINGPTWTTNNSGAVPGGYRVMEKGQSLPDISRGDNLDGKYLWLRQTLSTEDLFYSPKLEALKVEILGD